MQQQQQQKTVPVMPFKCQHGNPLTALFDHVARINQRELKPTVAEQRLISRCKLVKALLKYMDRQVDMLDGSPIYKRAGMIAMERFNVTTSTENLVGQLRKRIWTINMLKKSTHH